MARFIKNYCPSCGYETIHKIWKEDLMENTGATRLIFGVLTAGFSMMDSTTYCMCCSCGRTKII